MRAIKYTAIKQSAIMLRFQPCSAHYTVLQMKNNTRSTSSTKPVTIESTKLLKWVNREELSHIYIYIYIATVKQHHALSVKRDGAQRKIKVSPWCMYCVYCGMSKVPSWFEMTQNQTLTVIELHYLKALVS